MTDDPKTRGPLSLAWSLDKILAGTGYEDDSQRLVDLAAKHDFEITLLDAAAIWAAHSASKSATWLRLPDHFDDLDTELGVMLAMFHLVAEFGFQASHSGGRDDR